MLSLLMWKTRYSSTPSMGAGTDTLTFPSGCTLTPSDSTEMSIVAVFSSASNLYSSGSLSTVLLKFSSVISTFSAMSFAFLPKFPPVSVTPVSLFSSFVLPPPLQLLQIAKTHSPIATNTTSMMQSVFFFIMFSFFFWGFPVAAELCDRKTGVSGLLGVVKLFALPFCADHRLIGGVLLFLKNRCAFVGLCYDNAVLVFRCAQSRFGIGLYNGCFVCGQLKR